MSTDMSNLPLWGEILVAIMLLVGAGLTLTGAVGLLRLRSFFQRLHAPALGNTWGTWLIVGASMLAFSLGSSSLVLHEILIGAFVFVTSPVISILIVRAGLLRDRRRGGGQEDRPKGLTDEAE